VNHPEIEKQLVRQIHDLSAKAAQEVLDFARFLGQKPSRGEPRERPLGLLKGKASYRIEDDFAMTDDELLGR
jgi:hypothetical protein